MTYHRLHRDGSGFVDKRRAPQLHHGRSLLGDALCSNGSFFRRCVQPGLGLSFPAHPTTQPRSREGGDPLSGVSAMTMERVKPMLPAQGEMVQVRQQGLARRARLEYSAGALLACELRLTRFDESRPPLRDCCSSGGAAATRARGDAPGATEAVHVLPDVNDGAKSLLVVSAA